MHSPPNPQAAREGHATEGRSLIAIARVFEAEGEIREPQAIALVNAVMAPGEVDWSAGVRLDTRTKAALY
jgi:hypothetical protein